MNEKVNDLKKVCDLAKEREKKSKKVAHVERDGRERAKEREVR